MQRKVSAVKTSQLNSRQSDQLLTERGSSGQQVMHFIDK